MKKLADLKQSTKLDWRTSLVRLEGAYSDATLLAYTSDFTNFERWCVHKKRRPLPASPEAVATYLHELTDAVSVSTLRRRLAAIHKVHRLLKLESPVSHEEVTIAMRRAKRTKPSYQRQALGLTKDLKDRLIKACPDTLTGLRDRALISVGYDALCRRSELIALRIEDLELTQRRGGVVIIRRSKNDPFGTGRRAELSSLTAKYLKAWLSAAKLSSGNVFCKVDRNGYVSERPLHNATVAVIIKKRAQDARLPREKIKALSGHSMRVGAAQDMMKSGYGLLPIMMAGGWKTADVVGRYIENTDLRQIIKSSIRQGGLRI